MKTKYVNGAFEIGFHKQERTDLSKALSQATAVSAMNPIDQKLKDAAVAARDGLAAMLNLTKADGE